MWWRKSRRERSCGSGLSAGQRKKCQAALIAAIEQCEPRYLLSVVQPTIVPTTIFNITNPLYGAVDTSANNATAIQAAITAASKNKVVISGVTYTGGIVEIPAAAQDWESGPLTMASNVDLQIDAGATLQAVAMASYPNEGSSSVANFITSSSSATNMEITGAGIIDGNGATWWASSDTRPYLLKLSGNIMLIQGVTLQNSPMITLGFSSASNVTVNGITVFAPSTSPNTDGIDPEGSHYLIENCNISDGDDDIAIKPESIFCSDITITNCVIGTGHGISVGGETNDGLNGLTVTDITFNGTSNGLRLKAGRGSGGLVENVTYSDITMNNVVNPFYITSYYLNGSDTQPSNPATDPGQAVTSTTPIWENITFSNITSTDSASSSNAGILYAVPEEPIINVVFDNVKITAHTGMEVNNADDVSFGDGSKITVTSGNDLIATSSVPTPYRDTIVAEGYTDRDLGAPATAGTTLFNPDTSLWSIIAGGAGIGGASDQFNFASTSVTGNATYFAKVTSLSTANAGATAGVMFRDSSDTATAAFADAVVTPTGGVMFQWRTANGGTTGSTTVTGITAPTFVEVVRSGSSFSAFYSSDGVTWNQIGSAETITMSSPALVGLAVSSSNNASTSTATFSNLSGPTTSTPAAASSTSVNGNSTNLSVVGADSLGTTGLTYTWSATGPAAVTYSGNTNGTNAAQNITANFTQAGSYNFTATITDSSSLFTTTSVNVTVQQTATNIVVSPSSTPVVPVGLTQQFSATATDQFGNSISSPSFIWGITGGGNSIDGTGDATLGSTPGAFTVTASIGSAEGMANVIAENFAVPAGSKLDINLGTAGPVAVTATGGNITASQNGVQITLSGFTGVTVTDTASNDVLNFNGSLALPFTFVNCGGSSLNVNSGTLNFASTGTVITLGTLNIVGGATVDLANNTLILNYVGGNDPIGVIAGYLQSGYNGGAWNGAGIDSSTAASNPGYALGYADSADPGNPANLAADQIEIKYTLLGDADLDGSVTGIDFTILASHLGKSVSGWDQGDFFYTGTVTGADFTALVSNLGKTAQGGDVVLPASNSTLLNTTAPTSTVLNSAATTPAAPVVVSVPLTVATVATKSIAAAPTARKSNLVSVSKAVITYTTNGKPKASAVAPYAAGVVTIPTTGSMAAPQNTNKDAKFLADR